MRGWKSFGSDGVCQRQNGSDLTLQEKWQVSKHPDGIILSCVLLYLPTTVPMCERTNTGTVIQVKWEVWGQTFTYRWYTSVTLNVYWLHHFAQFASAFLSMNVFVLLFTSCTYSILCSEWRAHTLPAVPSTSQPVPVSDTAPVLCGWLEDVYEVASLVIFISAIMYDHALCQQIADLCCCLMYWTRRLIASMLPKVRRRWKEDTAWHPSWRQYLVCNQHG